MMVRPSTQVLSFALKMGAFHMYYTLVVVKKCTVQLKLIQIFPKQIYM